MAQPPRRPPPPPPPPPPHQPVRQPPRQPPPHQAPHRQPSPAQTPQRPVGRAQTLAPTAAPRAVLPPSDIDPAFPEQGNATTESVRANFLAARNEINSLYGHVDRIDLAASNETTRVNNALTAETSRTDLQFSTEQTRVNNQFTTEQTRVNQQFDNEVSRVNTQFGNEQTRVNNQFTTEQTRVNTALDARAMRSGDLGGSTTSSTVLRLQTHPVSAVAPVNTPRPAARKVLGWSGTQWEPDDVRQIQSWPISVLHPPAAGQALLFNGAEWEPASPTGVPDRIVWLPMPANIHDWIPAGTQGWFASEADGVAITTNGPGIGYWFFRAWSSSLGRIRIEALRYNTPAGVPMIKFRETTGVWSGWLQQEAPPVMQRFEGPGTYEYTFPIAGRYEIMVAAGGGAGSNMTATGTGDPLMHGGMSGAIARRAYTSAQGSVIRISIGANPPAATPFGQWGNNGATVRVIAPYPPGWPEAWHGNLMADGAWAGWNMHNADNSYRFGEATVPGNFANGAVGGEPAIMVRSWYYGDITATSGRGGNGAQGGGNGSAVIYYIGAS